MMKTNSTFYTYYDSHFDDLTVKYNDIIGGVYSDEIYNNIYLYRDNQDDRIVGTQILYFKNRSIDVLSKYLPDELLQCVLDIKRQISL